LIALRPWWDLDAALLEQAIELCDPTVQATKMRALEALFSEIQEVSEVSISASCDLYETYVAIEALRSDGRTFLWDLDGLIARTGDRSSIGQLVVADLG
jgi:hypothetical protein